MALQSAMTRLKSSGLAPSSHIYCKTERRHHWSDHIPDISILARP